MKEGRMRRKGGCAGRNATKEGRKAERESGKVSESGERDRERERERGKEKERE